MTKQPPTDELLFKVKYLVFKMLTGICSISVPQVKARQDENDKPFVIECEAEGEPAPV